MYVHADGCVWEERGGVILKNSWVSLNINKHTHTHTHRNWERRGVMT